MKLLWGFSVVAEADEILKSQAICKCCMGWGAQTPTGHEQEELLAWPDGHPSSRRSGQADRWHSLLANTSLSPFFPPIFGAITVNNVQRRGGAQHWSRALL